jgi:hypothetical protein
MSGTICEQLGIESFADLYSLELMRDASFAVMYGFDIDSEEAARRLVKVRKFFLTMSKLFPWRGVQLLRILFQSQSVNEIEKRLAKELEIHSRRDAPQTMSKVEFARL